MIFKIHDDVYGRDFIIALAETDRRILAAFKRHGYDLDDEFKSIMVVEGSGRTVLDPETGAHMVRLKDPIKNAEDVAILVHELTHATVQVFGIIGLPINTESDEAFAYYIQYLTRTCLEKIGG